METRAAPRSLPQSPLPPCRRESTCTERWSPGRSRRPSGCSPNRPIRSAAARIRIQSRAVFPCAGRPRWRQTAGTDGGKSYKMPVSVEYHIQHYDLEQGALEIQYIEEYFGEFPRKKSAVEIMRRLKGRAHIILIATAPLPDDPGSVVPVSFKVAHEIRIPETEPKLVDLMHRLSDYVQFQGRRVLYTWIGGTRRDWRGQGFFRALTEQQELWAIEQGFDEVVVKTKNKFYDMRGTLDHLRFEVVQYERNASDNAESKVYLSKKLLPETISTHRSAKTVVQMPV